MKSFKINRFKWIILFLPLCMAPTCQPKNIPRNRKPENIPRSGKSDLFGIYISTLDGKNMKPIITDSYREISHAHVSPDKKWIAFNRYRTLRDGIAEEKGGNYLKTEVVIARIDGTELESITGSRKGVVAVNSCWTPDGKGLIYLFNDFSKKGGQIRHIDIATRKTSRVPTPVGLIPADPHREGNRIVFPVIRGRDKPSCLWVMNADGTNAKQLTDPKLSKSARKLTRRPRPGDCDPKLSPDGSKVAVMRHVGEHDWHIVIVDVETGRERDISKGVTCDALPEWSSDGKLLIFWHVDTKNLLNSGLYTIKPDGSERKRIPLPRGYFYTMPAFFPGEGSGPNAQIIFSAKKMPGM